MCGCVLQRRQSSKLNWKCLIAQRFVVTALSTCDCIPDIVSHFTSRTKMQENPAIKKPQGYGRGPTWPAKKRRQDRLLPIVLSVGKGSGTFFFFFLGKSCSAVTSGRGRGKAINGKCSRSIFNNLGQSL